jgi:hypothetical protein
MAGPSFALVLVGHSEQAGWPAAALRYVESGYHTLLLLSFGHRVGEVYANFRSLHCEGVGGPQLGEGDA